MCAVRAYATRFPGMPRASLLLQTSTRRWAFEATAYYDPRSVFDMLLIILCIMSYADSLHFLCGQSLLCHIDSSLLGVIACEEGNQTENRHGVPPNLPPMKPLMCTKIHPSIPETWDSASSRTPRHLRQTHQRSAQVVPLDNSRFGQTLPVLKPFSGLGHTLDPPFAVGLFRAFRVEDVQDRRGFPVGRVKSFEGEDMFLPWDGLLRDGGLAGISRHGKRRDVPG